MYYALNLVLSPVFLLPSLISSLTTIPHCRNLAVNYDPEKRSPPTIIPTADVPPPPWSAVPYPPPDRTSSISAPLPAGNQPQNRLVNSR